MEFERLLDELGVHVPTVLERFCGNKGLLERFILKFPAEKTFALLNCAYEERRFEDAAREVHTLKGIAGNLGLETLHLGCADLLEDLRGAGADLAGKFGAIRAEYQRLTDCIAAYAASIQTDGLAGDVNL